MIVFYQLIAAVLQIYTDYDYSHRIIAVVWHTNSLGIIGHLPSVLTFKGHFVKSNGLV